MKNHNGITIISLVVTIVILIILAGISINLTIGEDGLITKAKQAKENIELAQIEEQTSLNELYSGLESELELGTTGNIDYDAITKLAEFKKAIADYIEEAGGVKPEYSAETTTFGDSIKGILKEVTQNATATPEDIATGKTAYVNGELITGVSNTSSYIKLGKFSGGATKTFDIKEITNNYEKLTTSNFVVNNLGISNYTWVTWVYAGINFSQISISYNATTGILTLSGGTVFMDSSGDDYLDANISYYADVYLLY